MPFWILRNALGIPQMRKTFIHISITPSEGYSLSRENSACTRAAALRYAVVPPPSGTLRGVIPGFPQMRKARAESCTAFRGHKIPLVPERTRERINLQALLWSVARALHGGAGWGDNFPAPSLSNGVIRMSELEKYFAARFGSSLAYRLSRWRGLPIPSMEGVRRFVWRILRLAA